MNDAIEIQPVNHPVRGEIRPPGSKSITNRALVCAALAEGESVLTGALDSEDTRVMVEGLRKLGVSIELTERGQTIRVAGCAGKPPAERADIFVGNSGTTIRFLTAVTTLGHGEFSLDGVPRMRERPIGDLAEALNQIGADVRCQGERDCPPVVVRARGLKGGLASVRGNISSQFLSGLLLAAPCAESDVVLRVAGSLVSVPYVAMTLRVMEAFGCSADITPNYQEMRVPHETYRAAAFSIEPDASAASYFWAAAAVTQGEVTVHGLTRNSLQGDVAFLDCLAAMGCRVAYGENSTTLTGGPLTGIDVDMNAISDTVQTLAVVAIFAQGKTKIRNVGHIRHKETDRLTALARELRKLGAEVLELPDGLEITPGRLSAATIDTYEDHRMAMSFAIAGLRTSGVVIQDPGCTSKTYPEFFADLVALTAEK